MSPADLHAQLVAARTVKDAVRAARDCARTDTREPMRELFEWAEESGDAHALYESTEASHAAVAYYTEHETHPVPLAWRDLFARVYVRESTRRDRARAVARRGGRLTDARAARPFAERSWGHLACGLPSRTFGQAPRDGLDGRHTMETVAVQDYVTAQTRGGLRLVVDAPPPGPRWVIQAGGRRGPVMHATAHTPAARIAHTGLVLGVLDGHEGAQVTVITYRGDTITRARTRIYTGGQWHEARAIGEVCDG